MCSSPKGLTELRIAAAHLRELVGQHEPPAGMARIEIGPGLARTAAHEERLRNLASQLPEDELEREWRLLRSSEPLQQPNHLLDSLTRKNRLPTDRRAAVDSNVEGSGPSVMRHFNLPLRW